jgi:hypothetical protein
MVTKKQSGIIENSAPATAALTERIVNRKRNGLIASTDIVMPNQQPQQQIFRGFKAIPDPFIEMINHKSSKRIPSPEKSKHSIRVKKPYTNH